MWDAVEEVARYEAWYASPRGAYALACEQRLIASLISAWPRRGHSLLEIGCGTGHFLEMFHNAGFDVTGLDSSLLMLEAAKSRMGFRATLRVGQAEHMPFDDGAFDFAAFVTSLECMDDREAALAEAFRVASKGVVIVFLNSWSLYRLELRFLTRSGLCGRLRKCRARRKKGGIDATAPEPAPVEKKKPADNGRRHALEQAHWYNLAGMLKAVYKASGKPPKCIRSVLFSPSMFWKGEGACRSVTCPLPFGAVVGLRVDLTPVCVTPIVVPSGKAMPVAQ